MAVVTQERAKWYAGLIDGNRKALREGSLSEEDVISNLQSALQGLVKENAQLEEELRIARSDNATLKEAIVNHFVRDHFNG